MINYLPHIFFALIGFIIFIFGVTVFYSSKVLPKRKQETQPSSKDSNKAQKSILDFFHYCGKKIKAGLIFLGILPKQPVYTLFRDAKKWLKENIGTKDYMYELPWYLLLGDENSGKTTLLNSLELKQPANHPEFNTHKHNVLDWWFFEGGVIGDISGTLFSKEASSSENASYWKRILKNLVGFRMRRPLDGIILTIPASYFMGRDALTSSQLQEKARFMAQQLKLVPKYLSLQLPLYVFVTKSDMIAGFSGYCQQLENKQLSQIFGWSSPYILTQQYTQNWMKEAFAKVSKILTTVGLTLFTKKDLRPFKDDIFLLAGEIQKIQEPLSNYLNHIFLNAGLSQGFLLRGLYFTGDKDADIQSQGTLDQNSTKTKISLPFLKDIFLKKIFSEYGLGVPLKRYLIAASHKINILKICILALLIGCSLSLYYGHKHIKSNTIQVLPYFQKAREAIETTRMYQSRSSDRVSVASFTFFQEQSEKILDLMIHAGELDVRTLLMPTSYLMPFESRVMAGVRVAYDRIIALALYEGLVARSDLVFRAALPGENNESSSNNTLMNPIDTLEFVTLQGYVDAVQVLERSAKIYQELQKDPTMSGLAFLSQYLFNFSFDEKYLENPNDISKQVIEQAAYPAFSLENYKILAQKRLEDLFLRFINRVLDPEINYTFLNTLQKELMQIDNRQGVIPKLGLLQETVTRLHQLKKLISSPDLDWLSRPGFNPGNDFEEMMTQLSGINLFSPVLISALNQKALEMYNKAQQNIKSYGSPLTGYFFMLSPEENRLDPSAGLRSLESSITHYLNQPFMQMASGKYFQKTISKNQILLWNDQVLKSAISLVQAYKKFIKNDLASYPVDLQESFKVLAEKQLSNNVADLVARAQTFTELPNFYMTTSIESDIHSQIHNLQKSGPVFLKLLQELQDIGVTDVYKELKDLTFNQMYHTLEYIEELLEQGGLYLPYNPSFQWWEGTPDALLTAYQMLDVQEMKSYLNNQEKRVMKLATSYAEPLLSFLSADIFFLNVKQSNLIDKWKRIVIQVADYKKKKVSNSVAKLRKFLLSEGNQITFKNCFEKITAQDSNARSADFFLQRRNTIRRSIYEQCLALAESKAIQKYNEIANYFNSYLAGNFPFTNQVPKEPQITSEVSDSSIMSFFTLFDTMTVQEKQAIIGKAQKDSTWYNAAHFLNQMTRIKEFLDTFFAPSSPKDSPGLSFDIELRVNQDHEVEGQLVMEWALAIAGELFSSKNGKKSGRWKTGEMSSFAFQWAKMAPLMPKLSSEENPINNKNTAIFLYEGHWSLMRAMMLNQATKENGASSNEDTLLQFNIPLIRESDPHHTVGQAVLFIKLIPKVAHGNPTQRFKIPVFPHIAPALKV